MAAEDLCTLASVRTWLQKSAGDTGQDAAISEAITHASHLISEHCGRQFAPTETNVLHDFAYYGQGYLSLAPFDLRTATSVQIDTDGSNPITLVAGTDYKLAPLPTRDGVYQWLELLTYDVPDIPGRDSWRQVSIRGDWGFAAIPSVVNRACIVTTGIWIKREIQAFTNTFNPDSGLFERPRELPSAVIGMLSRLRRR